MNEKRLELTSGLNKSLSIWIVSYVYKRNPLDQALAPKAGTLVQPSLAIFPDNCLHMGPPAHGTQILPVITCCVPSLTLIFHLPTYTKSFLNRFGTSVKLHQVSFPLSFLLAC